MDLSRIGEFGLIQRIQKNLRPPSSSVPLGIGDDAAAILSSPKKYLLLTTDSLLERVHFDLAYSSYSQIGYKAAAVNISDIAAMGGAPRYFLISLGLTGRQKVADLDQLYRGIEKGSREAGMDLIGGNTTYSKELFFISLTVVGEVAKKEMVTRAGARVGDALYVTGTLGNAAAGLDILKKGVDPKRFPELVGRYRAPRARWREGRLLAKDRIATAMIDLSDGLTSDLGHLAEQSGVGAELDLGRIPVASSLRRYASQNGGDPIRYALDGGEEYELLFSVPEEKIKMLENRIERGAIDARRIGVIQNKKKGLTARSPEGRLTRIAPGGYDHFKKK
jgi:thiamine-monophosphate kinase